MLENDTKILSRAFEVSAGLAGGRTTLTKDLAPPDKTGTVSKIILLNISRSITKQTSTFKLNLKNTTMAKERVCLAYSGGLDTSCILLWLIEKGES